MLFISMFLGGKKTWILLNSCLWRNMLFYSWLVQFQKLSTNMRQEKVVHAFRTIIKATLQKDIANVQALCFPSVGTYKCQET